MPISVMICELFDFKIIYLNESTRRNLKKIEHVLPCKVEALVGRSIDVFHKNPQHQQRLLLDPKNLPHKARITVGGEVLDLTVTAMTDSRGRYTGPMLSWELATEKARLESETARQLQMLDNMPINVMMCDTDFNVTYINKTSLNTLATVKHLLPVAPEQILGKSIDIFHKNPQHQRRLLLDPKNLPHAAKIKLGPGTLHLRVSALTKKEGRNTGAILSWRGCYRQCEAGRRLRAERQKPGGHPSICIDADAIHGKVTFLDGRICQPEIIERGYRLRGALLFGQ